MAITTDNLNLDGCEDSRMMKTTRSAKEIAKAEEYGRSDARLGKEPLWHRVGESYVHAETGHIGNAELGAAYVRGYSQEIAL